METIFQGVSETQRVCQRSDWSREDRLGYAHKFIREFPLMPIATLFLDQQKQVTDIPLLLELQSHAHSGGDLEPCSKLTRIFLFSVTTTLQCQRTQLSALNSITIKITFLVHSRVKTPEILLWRTAGCMSGELKSLFIWHLNLDTCSCKDGLRDYCNAIKFFRQSGTRRRKLIFNYS